MKQDITRNNIKAILFDFMGVLLFKRSDYIPDPLVDEIDNIIGKDIDDDLFVRETCSRFGLNKKKFSNILDRIINKYEPYQPLWNLLPELHKTYKLAIVNNGTSLTLPKFKEKLDIDSKFDLFISSAFAGIKKPDPEIYLLAAQKLGIKPHECLFMDDSYENIKGARSVGMKTLHWEKDKNRHDVFKEFVNFLKS